MSADTKRGTARFAYADVRIVKRFLERVVISCVEGLEEGLNRRTCRRLTSFRPCGTHDSRERGNARGQMQELSSVGKFHGVNNDTGTAR